MYWSVDGLVSHFYDELTKTKTIKVYSVRMNCTHHFGCSVAHCSLSWHFLLHHSPSPVLLPKNVGKHEDAITVFISWHTKYINQQIVDDFLATA